jgi:uncharacterized membrane protein YjjP (DUF1212 family)
MTDDNTKYSKWTLTASIIAIVLAVICLCGGWIFSPVSFVCALPAILLAALSLKSKRKTLPIIALVLSIVAFSLNGFLGILFWTNTSSPETIAMSKAFGTLANTIGQLFQSTLNLINSKSH